MSQLPQEENVTIATGETAMVKAEKKPSSPSQIALPDGFDVPQDWGVNDPLRRVITTLPRNHEAYNDMLLRHAVADTEDPEQLVGKKVAIVAFTCHLHNRTTQSEQEVIDTVRTVIETDDGRLYEFLALKPARTLIAMVRLKGFPSPERPFNVTVSTKKYPTGKVGYVLNPAV